MWYFTLPGLMAHFAHYHNFLTISFTIRKRLIITENHVFATRSSWYHRYFIQYVTLFQIVVGSFQAVPLLLHECFVCLADVSGHVHVLLVYYIKMVGRTKQHPCWILP